MIITGFSDVDICFVCIPNFYLTVLFAKIPHYFSPYHIFANVLHLSLSWCFRVSHIIISIQLVTAVCLCTICMYKKLQLIACKVLIFQIKIVISIVDSYHNPQKTSHYIGWSWPMIELNNVPSLLRKMLSSSSHLYMFQAYAALVGGWMLNSAGHVLLIASKDEKFKRYCVPASYLALGLSGIISLLALFSRRAACCC